MLTGVTGVTGQGGERREGVGGGSGEGEARRGAAWRGVAWRDVWGGGATWIMVGKPLSSHLRKSFFLPMSIAGGSRADRRQRGERLAERRWAVLRRLFWRWWWSITVCGHHATL